MAKLIFVPLDDTGYQELASWYVDPEVRRWYGAPTPTWLDYVQNEPGVYAWMIYENDSPVGHLQIDIKDGVGFIGFVIKPELRFLGYGRRILSGLFSRPEIAQVRKIISETEKDNIACILCMQSVGFEQETFEPDEHGFLRFTIYPHGTPQSSK